MTQHNLQGERMNLGGTGFQPVLAQLWEMGSWGEGVRGRDCKRSATPGPLPQDDFFRGLIILTSGAPLGVFAES